MSESPNLNFEIIQRSLERSWSHVAVAHIHPTRSKTGYYAFDELRGLREWQCAPIYDSPESVRQLLNHPEYFYEGPRLVGVKLHGSKFLHLVESRPGLLDLPAAKSNMHLKTFISTFDLSNRLLKITLHVRGQQRLNVSAKVNSDHRLGLLSFEAIGEYKRLKKYLGDAPAALTAIYESIGASFLQFRVADRGRLELIFDSKEFKVNELLIQGIYTKYFVAVTAKESPQSNLLMKAIDRGNVNAASKAIKEGARLDFIPGVNLPVVDYAFSPRHRGDWHGVLDLLIEKGALNCRAECFPPFISNAIQPGDGEQDSLAKVEYLAKRGFALNMPCPDGETLVHKAVLQRHLATLKYLVHLGLNTHAITSNGIQPRDILGQVIRNETEALILAVLDGGPALIEDLDRLKKLAKSSDQIRERDRKQKEEAFAAFWAPQLAKSLVKVRTKQHSRR